MQYFNTWVQVQYRDNFAYHTQTHVLNYTCITYMIFRHYHPCYQIWSKITNVLLKYLESKGYSIIVTYSTPKFQDTCIQEPPLYCTLLAYTGLVKCKPLLTNFQTGPLGNTPALPQSGAQHTLAKLSPLPQTSVVLPCHHIKHEKGCGRGLEVVMLHIQEIQTILFAAHQHSHSPYVIVGED